MWKGLGGHAALVACVVAMGTAVGCVIDFDRFTQPGGPGTDGGGGPTGLRSVKLHLVSMSPHEGHLFEYRVIQNDSNVVLFRGIQDAISSGDTDFYAPFALPRTGSYRLDYYADVNFSGTINGIIDASKGYDGTANSPTKDGGTTKDSDHAWRKELGEAADGVVLTDPLADVTFVHNTQFTDINTVEGTLKPSGDTGYPAVLRLENNPFIGAFTSVNVFNQASGQLVCQYRFRTSSTPTLIGTVPGCVDQVTTYRVEVYVDSNDNKVYDDPSKADGDWGYSQVLDSGRDSLEFVADLSNPTAGKANVLPPK